MSRRLPPPASTAAFTLRNACLVCSPRVRPTIFLFTFQAVCPEINTVLAPLPTTTWENSCSILEKRDGGFRCCFGIINLVALWRSSWICLVFYRSVNVLRVLCLIYVV